MTKADDRLTSLEKRHDDHVEVIGEINEYIESIERQLAEYKRKSDEFDSLTEGRIDSINDHIEAVAATISQVAKSAGEKIAALEARNDTPRAVYAAQRPDGLWDKVEPVQQPDIPGIEQITIVDGPEYGSFTYTLDIDTYDDPTGAPVSITADDDAGSVDSVHLPITAMDRIAREWLTYSQQSLPVDALMDSVATILFKHHNGYSPSSDEIMTLESAWNAMRAPAKEQPATSTVQSNADVYVVYDDNDLSSESPVRIATFYTETAAYDFAGAHHGYRYEIESAQQSAQKPSPEVLSIFNSEDARHLCSLSCDIRVGAEIVLSEDDTKVQRIRLRHVAQLAQSLYDYVKSHATQSAPISTSRDDDAGWQLAKRLYDALSERHDGIQYPYSETDTDGALGPTLSETYDALKDRGFFQPEPPNAPQFEDEPCDCACCRHFGPIPPVTERGGDES